MTQHQKIGLEVCVDSPESLDAALAGGANRIELCACLELGGLTPSPGLIHYAAQAGGSVYAMIRPRAGSLVFTPAEIEVMRHDIEFVGECGLAGVVLGTATADGSLDKEGLAKLIHSAGSMGKTLHRAIDLTPDPYQALEDAIALGFERILTSGQAKSALEGIDVIANLVKKAAGRLSIMPGSGVKAENVLEILAKSGASEVHASCSVPAKAADARNQALGFEPLPRKETLQQAVAELFKVLNG